MKNDEQIKQEEPKSLKKKKQKLISKLSEIQEFENEDEDIQAK